MMFIVPEIAFALTFPALRVLSTPSAKLLIGLAEGATFGAYYDSRKSM
jgi:hypothetical protein